MARPLIRIMIKQRILIHFFLLVAQTIVVSAETNIAAGKRYTLKPAPNHHRCIDSGGKQLTDGKAKGAYWSQTTTVGWNDAAYITIQFDLERHYTIQQVAIHSIGGGFANVDLPEFVVLTVSSDGQACNSVMIASKAEWKTVKSVGRKGQPYKIVLDDFQVNCRYITLLLKASYRHFFIDEVEIFGYPSNEKDDRKHGYPFYNNTDKQIILAAQIDRQLLRVDGILGVLDNYSPFDRSKVRTQLLSIKKDIETGNIFDTAFIKEQKNRINGILAVFYQRYYNDNFAIVRQESMKQPNEAEIVLGEPSESASVYMWQNEHEPQSVNFINCSLQPAALSISISPLAGDTGHIQSTENVIQIRRGVYVRALNAGYIADALPLFGDMVVVDPGEVLPLWIDINSKYLPEGNYKAAMLFEISPVLGHESFKNSSNSKQPQATQRTFNLELEVSKRKFPEVAVLTNYCCSWLSPGTLADTRKDLDEHHINVSTFASFDIPWPDSTGEISVHEFKRNFERVTRRASHAKQLRLFLNFNSKKRDKGRFGNWLSTEWKSAFSKTVRGAAANFSKADFL